MRFLDEIDNSIRNFLSPLGQNENLANTLIVLLIIYSAIFPNYMSENTLQWFNNPIVKLILLFLIAYIIPINLPIALMLTIGFLVSLQVYYSKQTNNEIYKIKQNETMDAMNDQDFLNVNTNENLGQNVSDDLIMQLDDDNYDYNQNLDLKVADTSQQCSATGNYKDDAYQQYAGLDSEFHMSKQDFNGVSAFNNDSSFAAIY
ncbi:Hypothetical protein KVN_LOCUS353 [uncultured virus]|nr:Hypothetical protein KVN_LOCUS353 [uncultured virus]